MNIFFDVDYTILGLDDSIRPNTAETFQKLLDCEHSIYIWSGLGERWEVVKKHNLEQYVSGVYEKPTHHFLERLTDLGVPLMPDFVVDDYPEVVAAFGGVWVPPYFYKTRWDGQMERIYNIIGDFVRKGHSDDVQYRAKGSTVPPF